MDNKKQENAITDEVKIEENKKIVPAAVISPNPNIIFADSTIVSSSKFDTKIYFGFTLPQGGSGITKYDTVITLSPQLAKALAQSLEKSVGDYERDFMPLKMHDEK